MVIPSFSADNGEIVARVSVATIHARKVAKRDHVKATLAERVGIFMTSLRHEIGVISQTVLDRHPNISNVLCDKSAWADIGLLESNRSLFHGRNVVIPWCIDLSLFSREAADRSCDEGEECFGVDGMSRQLAGMRVTVDSASMLIAQAAEINNRAFSIVNDLGRVFF